MITYEEALSIARKYKTHINLCTEYTNAYSFEFDTGFETFGGNEPIVVLKENGRVMKQIEYAITGNKSVVRAFAVD